MTRAIERSRRAAADFEQILQGKGQCTTPVAGDGVREQVASDRLHLVGEHRVEQRHPPFGVDRAVIEQAGELALAVDDALEAEQLVFDVVEGAFLLRGGEQRVVAGGLDGVEHVPLRRPPQRHRDMHDLSRARGDLVFEQPVGQ